MSRHLVPVHDYVGIGCSQDRADLRTGCDHTLFRYEELASAGFDKPAFGMLPLPEAQAHDAADQVNFGNSIGHNFGSTEHLDNFVAHPFSPFLALVECMWPISAFCKVTGSRNRCQIDSTEDRSLFHLVETCSGAEQSVRLLCDIAVLA